MIEFCTKRRMILAIVGLIIVSTVVLFAENRLAASREVHNVSGETVTANATFRCWEVAASVTVIKECLACSVFEQKSAPGCEPTGYAEWVSCKMKDGNLSELRRSCPKISWVEEKRFWMFETFVAFLGLASYSMVHMRQKRLDRMLIEKVNKQIANGV